MKITNVPDSEKTSELFTAKVNGVPVKACFARVSAMPFNCIWPGHQRDTAQTEEAAFISFSMDKAVEIELTFAKNFDEVIIRPVSKKVVPEVDCRVIKFTIEKVGQYSVEIDGIHNTLYIFADPEIDFSYGKDVIYYGPGVHHTGMIELTDGQTLYIDRDAVVYGAVRAINAANISIIGNGILDNSFAQRTDNTLLVAHDIARRNTDNDRYSPFLKTVPSDEPQNSVVGSSILKDRQSFIDFLSKWNMIDSPVQLYGCNNVELNGLIIRDSAGFTVTAANCENFMCDNVKIVGNWRYNSDGIDLFNSSSCVIRNSFLRTFDDSIALKGIIGWDKKSFANILVENCVVWNDWGRALEIGAETCADEYRDIVFRDCNVIHASHTAIDIQSCDRAWVHDVLYENINVEYSRYDLAEQYQHSDDEVYDEKHGKAALIGCCFGGENYYSNDRVKGRISNITFRNINAYADAEDFVPKINIQNHDDEHTVSDIVYDGIFVNGNKTKV